MPVVAVKAVGNALCCNSNGFRGICKCPVFKPQGPQEDALCYGLNGCKGIWECVGTCNDSRKRTIVVMKVSGNDACYDIQG